nr:ankyrin-2 isoform X6 [Parasteatoda tepidariorum]
MTQFVSHIPVDIAVSRSPRHHYPGYRDHYPPPPHLLQHNHKKTDGNASFLRAARSGNVEKIVEYLKGNIDINTSNANGLNALHLAAKEGHVNVVTELLKRGANVNAATKKGNTALHIASLAGQEEIVKVLIQLGANVNVQSQNGFTPLYMAAQENHDSVVSFLLANGANQSLATEDGFTPLAVALQQGHDKVVAVLLENDTKGRVRLPALHIAAKKDDCKAATLLLQSDHNPDVTSKSGFTPLHIAAHYGNENIAKILLSKGADVNYAAKHQITPLHVASKWGKINMVMLLLEKGANIEAATRDGLTPLHCAARSGHDQVVDLLLEKGAPFLAKTKNGLAPLHMASQGDHVDSARILLYHKAPVDDVTVDYLTALHVAAHCGHVKVAKLLLDRKADPNARALNGFTPLHIACKKNRIKVVELLLKHGASIEATTESGLTPLHVASFMGCMNIVIYLIQNGSNPDVPTVRGETPLHLAARANQTDIIRILLRNGASVDARAREEQTPLHIASRLGNVDIVSLLLQHGAAVDATTKDMYTALHIASKEDQEEVASSLLDHGASLTATTKKGFTPLHLAAKYGNIKVARLLLQKGAAVDAQGKNGVTPLHVASHYDHVNVALLLLEKGASPHAMAKNGYTPLHIAAKKNQMDIASTLLEYGANANAESKAGFTPLHLASQEGHADISSLLIDHKAKVNHKANNGLTPLHLCAQDDKVNVATILVDRGAEIGPQTKAGYTPLHVASHFGQINMVRFLIQNKADIHTTTSHGYTALHQAAQQGHTLVVNHLLENQASPNVTTTQGQTPLSIAQRLGYISVVETLKVVTETTVTTTTTTVTEEKYKVVAPETMQETFMTDSEDEGGADFDEAAIFGKPTHATHVYLPFKEGSYFQMSEEAMLGDQSYRYLTADEMKSLGDDSLPIDVTKDEKHHDVMHSVKQFGAPMVEEDKLSPQHGTPVEGGFSEKFSPDNIDLGRVPVHAGRFSWADDFYSLFPKGMSRSRFLVSFMVDARGGAMRGCRHSGVRVIIPPRKASMPMRITCRYLRKEKLIHPPPLMEGEACASRILEMGPVGARFLGPVIIEVPHFASTRGKEREITILRSDTGESWREHTLEASEEAVQEVLNESFEGEELSALEDLNTNRITRILTTDFPQYFAIVTRVRQEVHGVGPEGGMVSSTVVPQVQAIFPEGALTKKIRVGLQAQPIAPELVAKLLGNRVAVSPIVTVEPRRRKFHKPITLTIPVPQAATKGMINQYSGDAPTLRLLCSITGSTKSGGSSKAQWEDVTGSTPLTFVNDCVSFTTTVSARFWLMDCRQVNEVTRYATELYQEAVYVPFMSKFVIFAKRYEPYEAQLRVFCMTDDKEDKTLECQEHFTEVAKSRDVEVLEGKLQYLEFAGNLAPVTKSGEQLKLDFQAFHENRLPFTIRVKDPHMEPMGRIAFMREPKTARGDPPQTPICNLNVVLPEVASSESSSHAVELVTLEKKYDFMQESGLSKPEVIHRADLRLSDIARELDKDWVPLAQQLELSDSDVSQIKAVEECENSEKALMMLRLWLQKSGSRATGNELEKGLRKINREDIIKNCMFNVELVTDDVEKAVAKVHLDQSGFDVFKEELGSSREASMRRGASLDASVDEQDITKEAESAAETSSETGSLFERDQISQAFTDELMKDHIKTEDLTNLPTSEEINQLFPKCKLTPASQSETTMPHSSDNNTKDPAPAENIQLLPDDESEKRTMSVVDGEPLKKIENGINVDVIEQQNEIRTHEFWPPDKISSTQTIIVTSNPTPIGYSMNEEPIEKVLICSSPDNQKVSRTDTAFPTTADSSKVLNTQTSLADPSVLECAGAESLSSDLGYCSMDKEVALSSKTDNYKSGGDLPMNISTVIETVSTAEISGSSNDKNRIISSSEDNSVSGSKIVEVSDNTLPDSSKVSLEYEQSVQHQLEEHKSEQQPKESVAANSLVEANVTKYSSDNSPDVNVCVEDAKIRRASKTPPPSPADEEYRDNELGKKLKEVAFPTLPVQSEVKEELSEIVGAQDLPIKLTESETWPSLEMDTSQVSISSLPDDEKSEPTTATIPLDVERSAESQTQEDKTDAGVTVLSTHLIQKTTHMTLSSNEPEDISLEASDLKQDVTVPKLQTDEQIDFAQSKEPFVSSSSPILADSKVIEQSQTVVETVSSSYKNGDVKVTTASITIKSAHAPEADISDKITKSDISESVGKIVSEHGEKLQMESVLKSEQMLTESELKPELDLKSKPEASDSSFVPCAFVNTAFAGAELIDEVEQVASMRSRSPYEVVRDGQIVTSSTTSHTEEQTSDIPASIVRSTFVTRSTEIIRRPLLQHIPSEISEEDLVEREISSPITKEYFEEFSRSTGGQKSEPLQSAESSTADYKLSHSATEQITSHSSEAAFMDSSKTSKSQSIVRTSTVTQVSSTISSEGKIEGTLESDTGIPSSPFELISESEISDKETRSGTLPLSLTMPKSDEADKSPDSVIMSASFTDKTFSADGVAQKDSSESCTLNEGKKDYQIKSVEYVLNGPGEVEYTAEYDDGDEYGVTKSSSKFYAFEESITDGKTFHESVESEEVKKSHYSSVSDDVADAEIGEILKSDHQMEDIIERPVTPEPPVDDFSGSGFIRSFDAKEPISEFLEQEVDEEADYSLSADGEQAVSSPPLSPDDSKSGFAYGMQFEKDILDLPDEAMDVDSDQLSEEKESMFSYGMRFEQDHDLEEDIPCYGDLYTHEEVDEDALENGEKSKIIPKYKKDPEFDILAGKKYFSKNVDLDEMSTSSLQEFERLEAEIVSGRKSSIGSIDSLNGKLTVSKSGDHDDVSMSSLTEFERLEKECIETDKIPPEMQESITQLSEIEEGHESQASETSQENKSDAAREEDMSIADEYDAHFDNIEEIILKSEKVVKDELPYQILIKQAQKPVDASLDQGMLPHKVTETTKLSNIETKITTVHTNKISLKSTDRDSREDKSEDIEQDSLREEFSLKPDSLTEDRQEYLDSLHEGKCDDVDSLQGDEMRDSLFEDRHLEDDSLHEMDILPDESSLSLESSFAAAMSHDSSKADEMRSKLPEVGETTVIKHLTTNLKGERTEIVVTEIPNRDVMLSSTDSLEQSSSAAAAFHLESESAMSTSLTSALMSEDNTMVSSTDTLEQEGRITFRYEDIPVDELEILVKDGRKVIVDSEGNIQTEYNVEHFLASEDNMNDFNIGSKDKIGANLPSASTTQVYTTRTTSYASQPKEIQQYRIYKSMPDESEPEEDRYESSQAEPDIEIEEIHTTDEFGNPRTIKKMKKVIHTKTQFSSSSSSNNVEEKLKEFLREHAAGETAGLGEEEVQEERSFDEKGNVVLVRTVQQKILTEPEVHSRTFTGPEADTLSQEFVDRFKSFDPSDDTTEFEKVDEQGNVIRVTKQVIIKPEVHSVSFSGPNAHQQMEEYMKQWNSRNGDGASSHFSSHIKVSRTAEECQELIPSGDTEVKETISAEAAKTLESTTPHTSEQTVTHTTTIISSHSESGEQTSSGSGDKGASSAVE